MSQSNRTSRWANTADGVNHDYDFTTKIFAASEIKVYVDGTLKTLTTHYTVSINSNVGGTVSITDGSDTSGKSVVLSRNVADTQLSDYVEGDSFPADTIEDDLDRRAIVDMQLADAILRAARAPENDPVGTDMVLPAKAARLGKLLRFNATTGLPEMVAVANLDLVALTAIGESIIEAADAAAVRTLLGLGALALLATVGSGQIDDEAVTNPKLAHMAQSTVKGRAAGAGTGDATDLTAAQATAILDAVVGDSGAGGTKGLVPAPAAGDAAAGKYLKADGAWTAISAGIVLQAVGMTIPEASGTTSIPQDDTLPQSTEGTEAGSQAIVMADDTNKVLIIGALQVGFDTTNADVAVAVFRGTTCIHTRALRVTAAMSASIALCYLDSPGAAGSVTYSVRIGGTTAGQTWRLGNTAGGGADFGDTADDGLVLMEIAA